MNEVSKKPWRVDLSSGYIYDAKENLVVTQYDYDVDAEHIVQCVNEYDQLKAENERLKKTVNKMAEFIQGYDVDEDICKNVPDGQCRQNNYDVTCKKCIIQYFSKESEERECQR